MLKQHRGRTTILVVDDESVSRRLASRLLSEEGYRLIEADGATEALEVLGQAQGRVDLILMDVVMPGCSGVQLGQRVLETWPSLPILYMSAYPAEVLREGLPTDEVPFLPKPYTRDEALEKVREALALD